MEHRFPEEAVRAQVDRLERSGPLSRSKRLVRFLRYTVAKALANLGDSVNEYSIADEVYDRKENFDPAADGIVRAEAYRLRAKLDEYYRTTGRHDPIVVEFPTGSYVPIFKARSADFLPETSKMADRIRAIDWAAVTLGPITFWPRRLKSTLALCLRSEFPIALFWGPDFIIFANDAANDLIAGCCTALIGRPAHEAPVSWSVLGPILRDVWVTGRSVMHKDQLWLVNGGDWQYERYFCSAYSVIPDGDGETCGIVNIISETTASVVDRRRSKTLAELALQSPPPQDAIEACRMASLVLRGNPYDVPFVSIYLLDESGRRAILRGCAGIEPGTEASPTAIALDSPIPSPLGEAAATRRRQVLAVEDDFGSVPCGAWKVRPRELVVMPIDGPARTSPFGFIVAGANPHKPLDAEYCAFFDSMARQLATVLSNVRKLEVHREDEARKAEMDRIRKRFVMNIKDEIRTPMTVVLGLLDSVLESSGIVADHRQRLARARVNAMRMLRLSTSYLDFAQLQEGILQPAFEEIPELATLTAELAGMFRETVEHSGLQFFVDCPVVGAAAYVDRSIWEKIVFGLLLSALNSTDQGAIGLRLHHVGNWFELTVWDTSPGIPPVDLPHIFEPFYEISGANRASAREGLTLALIEQFVRIHGGKILVSSEVNRGTRFIVSIPAGKSHLPPDRITNLRGMGLTPTVRRTYVEEALRWTPQGGESIQPGVESESWYRRSLLHPPSGHLLIAETDRDLRQYVRDLLGVHYQVTAVSDPQSILPVLRSQRVDLVLLDALMHRGNTMGIVREIRSDPQLSATPIILLSSRAAERERLQALSSGVDDCLVKPFLAQDLLIRVQSQIALAEARKKVGEKQGQLHRQSESLRHLFEVALENLPEGIVLIEVPSGVALFKNKVMDQLFGERERNLQRLSDLPDGMAFHMDGRPYTRDEYPAARTMRTGETIVDERVVAALASGRAEISVNSRPIRGADGLMIAVLLTFAVVKAEGLDSAGALASSA